MQTTNATRIELPSCRYFPLLQRKDATIQNEDVRYLQRLLNVSGASLNTDGSFGPKTQQALISFQQQKQIAADGIVGPKTWNKLGVCTTVF
ncbi:peptidoglycan-binding domain-containing protein [Microcoleus sp. A2-C5]|uniref:peptidoglycan-binding domain-containing protein n=1 Tax=Microcoleaceae TaxID=1892252 RepID=UPI002237824F|nr:peptidoglycan-binding domain-containing protein [Lyngbya sp. CCAP 1446/10]MCW6052406.1 peptidoglycan-binding protein [Lyngbya sp. CCAP 1446/10]